MKNSFESHVPQIKQKLLIAAISAALANSAMAFEFETDGGWRGNINTTVSASASWRAENRDKALVWENNAAALGIMGAKAPGVTPGWGGALTDDGNLNYAKGDRYQTLFKFISELNVSNGDTGALVRVKGWYDQSLKDEAVPWGNSNTGYGTEPRRTSKKLSDNGFDPLARFDGLYLLDAYAYTSIDVGNNPLQIRVGRQAVNWGESLFVQGLNQLAPLDIIALRKAGTEIKEALLPVWSLYGNLGLPKGMSLEGYYQLKWEPSAIDSCGTYWSPTDTLISTKTNSCSLTQFSIAGLESDYAGVGVDPILNKDGYKAKNSGQWGLALRFPVDAIDTEFGLYAMNIHSRTPIISGTYAGGLAYLGTPAGGAAVVGMTMAKLGLSTPAAAIGALGSVPGLSTVMGYDVLANGLKSFWEYPENIKIYGISAATNIMGWSTGWELSFQKDVPVQFNGNDMLQVAASGAGALGGVIKARGTQRGQEFQGFERFNKTQFQVNGVYLLPAMLGASNGLAIAETAFQWNNIPKSNGTTEARYGRAFIFGGGNGCLTPGASGYNPQLDGCKNEGYINDFAWGYRIKASLDYAGIFDSSWTMTPSLFWAHDVKGYSMDSQFNEGSKTTGLGLKFSLNKVHTVELNYTNYANSATYNMFRDRDNYSATYSYTF